MYQAQGIAGFKNNNKDICEYGTRTASLFMEVPSQSNLQLSGPVNTGTSDVPVFFR